jgi:hypothetical protein
MRALAAVKTATRQKRRRRTISNHGKTQEKEGATTHNRHTFRSMSSFLNLDALSTKREEFLHQISAEQNYMIKDQATKESSTRRTTHTIRRSRWSMNFKRSTHCRRPLQTLGSISRSTFLRRDY